MDRNLRMKALAHADRLADLGEKSADIYISRAEISVLKKTQVQRLRQIVDSVSPERLYTEIYSSTKLPSSKIERMKKALEQKHKESDKAVLQFWEMVMAGPREKTDGVSVQSLSQEAGADEKAAFGYFAVHFYRRFVSRVLSELNKKSQSGGHR